MVALAASVVSVPVVVDVTAVVVVPVFVVVAAVVVVVLSDSDYGDRYDYEGILCL